MNGYTSLNHAMLKSGTQLLQPVHNRAGATSLDQPALEVMTDFLEVRPLTIAPTECIDQANARMIHCGVRLLFVLQADCAVAGLITSSDILGEKPYQYLKEHGGNRNDILVQDIMLPINRLEALYFDEVQRARVGNVAATLKTAGRQHLLVVDRITEQWTDSIRGMFSASQLALQLGIDLESDLRAGNFAELGTVIQQSM